MTDIATGWTECVAMRIREQMLIVGAFEKVAAVLPFAMLGVDSDNDSAVMSESVFDYCKGHGLVQTRSRAYKKNDQAWVEQKNGAILRRLVGYGRLSGVAATKALATLYASSRLYVNFFQPSFKLKSKTRYGAKVHKIYFTLATSCDRLLAHASIEPAIKARLKAQFESLDPVRLLQDIWGAQQTLREIAAPGAPNGAAPTRSPDVDAWPLVDGWLIAEPSASAKELMDRLATMFPEAYAGNAQLRTLQRRVQAWRAEGAKEMILGRLRKSTGIPAEV